MGKIHFFTGKGGVGKSTLALSKALHLSGQEGARTLLVEFSQFNTLGRHLGQNVGFEPQLYQSNLFVATWDGEDCLREYVRHSVKIRFIFEIFLRTQSMSALIKAAPALRELSFLGYLTSHFRNIEPQLDYDHIVVDAPATGHFISCLQIPEALLDITDRGPMGEHCRGIIEVLKDSTKTQIYNVCLPEPLVLQEQQELQQVLSSDFGVSPRVILNQSLTQAGLHSDDLDHSMSLHSSAQRYLDHLNATVTLEEKQLFKESKEGGIDFYKVIPTSLKLGVAQVAQDIVAQGLWSSLSASSEGTSLQDQKDHGGERG